MRLCVLNEKLIGKKLAVPIYNQAGIIYLNNGLIFSEKSINQIKRLGINTVYIGDDTDDVTLQEIYDTPLRLNAINTLNSVFNDCKKNKYISEKPIIRIVEDIIKNVNISENAYLYNNIAKNDEKLTLCTHSLNVAILSIVIGYTKNYNQDKLLKLGIGAILHDVGKLFVDGEEHVLEGYKLVKNNSYFALTSCTCLRSHHENENGTGYPEKLKGDKIYEFAKIVAICNEYINILDSNDAILPHVAIEKITAIAGQKFNNDIYRDFIRSIYCYPNGLKLKLNNGLDAIVISQNKNMPSRPIVGFKENGEAKYYDLAKELTLFVKEVLF